MKQQQEVFLDFLTLRKRLVNTMRKHIGRENGITPERLFFEIYRQNPESMSVFERVYWWNKISSNLSYLRTNEIIYTISERVNGTANIFVLKTMEECRGYKKKVDAHIKGLRKSQENAETWVRKRKYLRIKEVK